jgi:CRP/FNR family transcriptional regulator, anaerobic regulatory protein
MNTAARNVVLLNSSRQKQRASVCEECAQRAMCPVAGLEDNRLVVQRVIQNNHTVYEAGDHFDGIYIVRSGFLKSYSIDTEGVMQVTGFHFTGEFFGMDGIESGSFGDYVEALDTSSVCKIPLELFSRARSTAMATCTGDEQAQSPMLALVKLMSRTISSDHNLFFTLGKMSARRRIGVFLKDLSERMEKSGYSGEAFTLFMSRTDIANYLCLALETVSRLFSQLQAEGVISINRRKLKLLDKEALVHDDAARQERIRKVS